MDLEDGGFETGLAVGALHKDAVDAQDVSRQQGPTVCLEGTICARSVRVNRLGIRVLSIDSVPGCLGNLLLLLG